MWAPPLFRYAAQAKGLFSFDPERDLPSAPSRFEVEHLHRLMMQSSVEAAGLDKQVWTAQQADGLSPLLRGWHEAASAVQSAFERAAGELKKEGTSDGQIDRLRARLSELRSKSAGFNIFKDLEVCVHHWQGLGLEFSQLSGKQRDPLVKVLERWKPKIDESTAQLSGTLKTDGMLPEHFRKLRDLQDQREQARGKYERLRQKYLAAEKDHQAAERQKAQAPSGGREHPTQHATSAPTA